MARWVIDENIFYIASNPNNDQCSEAIYFTETIYKFHLLVLDHEGKLMDKYRKLFALSKLLRIWFTKINKNAGHVVYCTSNLTQAIESKLDQLGFDPDDKCFVGASLNAGNIISSEDGDFKKQPVYNYFTNDLRLTILTLNESASEEAKMR